MGTTELLISDLENLISERVFIKIENWNLYLGDAGLSRKLAIEFVGNLDKGNKQAIKISLMSVHVRIGEGIEKIPLLKFITENQMNELEDIINEVSFNR